MRRGDILRLLPCRHMLHSECTRPLFEYSENINCPICRTAVTGNEAYERKNYAKTSQRDRELIVECSNRGEDWTGLAKNLGVKYQTAYSWIRSGSTESKKRGGARPRILTSDHVNLILEWLEQDCSLSLVQIKAKLLRDCNIAISTSSVANYLEGQLFTTKQVHWQPTTMNSVRNKELRKNYVTVSITTSKAATASCGSTRQISTCSAEEAAVVHVKAPEPELHVQHQEVAF